MGPSTVGLAGILINSFGGGGEEESDPSSAVLLYLGNTQERNPGIKRGLLLLASLNKHTNFLYVSSN